MACAVVAPTALMEGGAWPSHLWLPWDCQQPSPPPSLPLSRQGQTLHWWLVVGLWDPRLWACACGSPGASPPLSSWDSTGGPGVGGGVASGDGVTGPVPGLLERSRNATMGHPQAGPCAWVVLPTLRGPLQGLELLRPP